MLKAKGTTNSKDEKNRELLELAGQVEATMGIYFKSLHRLKKTYKRVEGEGSATAKQILAIKTNYKFLLCEQIKLNNGKSSMEMEQLVNPQYEEVQIEGDGVLVEGIGWGSSLG